MTDTPNDVLASYESHFAHGEMRDSDAYYRWILKKLRPEPGSDLLDVACGQGILCRFASEAGLRSYGVDFSRQAIITASRTAPAGAFCVSDGTALPFPDSSFRHVTSLGSLEHYDDPWQGAAEIRRVLKPDGMAAIFLPNNYYLADLVWHVLRKGRGPSHRQVIERFAARREWETYLTMMGLEVVRTHRYNFCFPRTTEDWRWYRRYPTKLLYLLSGPVTPLNLSYSFLYLCRKAEPRPELNAKLPFALRRREQWL